MQTIYATVESLLNMTGQPELTHEAQSKEALLHLGPEQASLCALRGRHLKLWHSHLRHILVQGHFLYAAGASRPS